jgi:uncharacterized protein with PIN domain
VYLAGQTLLCVGENFTKTDLEIAQKQPISWMGFK